MRPSGVRLIKIGDGDNLTETILAVLREGKKQKTNKSDDWNNIDAVLRVYEDLLKPKSVSQVSQIQNLKSKI
jgi:hypothetical protein